MQLTKGTILSIPIVWDLEPLLMIAVLQAHIKAERAILLDRFAAALEMGEYEL